MTRVVCTKAKCVVCDSELIKLRPVRVMAAGLREAFVENGYRCPRCGIHYDEIPKCARSRR